MAIPVTAKVVTFICTFDRERSKAFYGGTLGFTQTHEDDFAVVFDLHGTMLRVSEAPDFKPAEHTVLGWVVADIVATVKALRLKGVKFNFYDGFGQDELDIWTVPGLTTRVAWFEDPDGNVLSLTQF
jgi:catechol 2,3-dioxygenase-like lactoylglutathione lyase family enzyme